MTVYYFLFVLTALASLSALDSRIPERPASLLIVLSIILVVGLRYNSVDYFSYQDIYVNIGSIENFSVWGYEYRSSARIDSAFAALALIEKAVFGSFFVFVFIYALISISIKFSAFIKLSPFVPLSILIYLSDTYFWKDQGQIRNAMASGIVLFSLAYVHDRKPFHFFSLILIAASVHSFAAIAAGLYFVRNFSNSILMSGALVAAIIIAYFGGVGIAVAVLISSAGLPISPRVLTYIDSSHVEGIRAFGGTFMMHVVVASALIFFKDKLVQSWSYNAVIIPTYVYGTVLMFIFIDYGIIAGRTRELLCVPTVAVALPSLLFLVKPTFRPIPFAAILAYCMIWFVTITNGNQRPYESIFGVV